MPRWRSPLPSGIFASLGIKAFNRFCCLPVHLTNPPDFLSLPAARFWLKLGLRITVPGPLRFRRLAVPQTSWNLIHYAPHMLVRQHFLCAKHHFSSAFILFIFNRLWVMPRASPVYKTYPRCLDFAIL
jgi:hypothetical protein